MENAFYAQNMKTALLLGQVRGAVLVAVAGTGCGLAEYSALEIKKAVTGYGQADKEQVLTMVRVAPRPRRRRASRSTPRTPWPRPSATSTPVIFQIKVEDKEPS
ncbi:MAG: crossover junction endodeoxyribonuclease RuvC [Candidatus Moduliflexus flocculans]|nr:crossover junction endodeoxyribonuclease RuvC [Candidatus Moduliflexus flocculans]